MKIGYCTKYHLGDKVIPVINNDDYPIMTICAIQLVSSQGGIRETYLVDWFDNGFSDCWVETHQITKAKESK